MRPGPAAVRARAGLQRARGSGSSAGRGEVPRGAGTLLWVATAAFERPRSHVQQQMLPLPRADHLQEHLVLGLLDDRIGGDKRLAEYLQQRLAVAQLGQRLIERSRQ